MTCPLRKGRDGTSAEHDAVERGFRVKQRSVIPPAFVRTFELNPLSEFLHLQLDIYRIWVTVAVVLDQGCPALLDLAMGVLPARRFWDEEASDQKYGRKSQLKPRWNGPRYVGIIANTAPEYDSSQNGADIVAAVAETGDYPAIHWMGNLDNVRRPRPSNSSSKTKEETPGEVLRKTMGGALHNSSHDDD